MLKFLHRDLIPFISERPAFIKMVDMSDNIIEINNGYILQVNPNNLFASVIKFKKGGTNMATKTILKAKPKFEAIFDELNARKAELDSKKEIALNEAIAKATADVEADFANEAEIINNMLAEITEEEVIEVEDEEIVANDETSENGAVVENTNDEQPANNAQIF